MGPVVILEPSIGDTCTQPGSPRSDGNGYYLCGGAAVMVLKYRHGDKRGGEYSHVRCYHHGAQDIAEHAMSAVCLPATDNWQLDWSLRKNIKDAFQSWVNEKFVPVLPAAQKP